jgi:hypothetical protein
MNPGAEGITYPEFAFEVDPERVAAFRQVVGETSGVPPTFVTVAEFTVFPDVTADPRVGLDLRRVLHSAQEYAFERPLREGETLTGRTRIGSVRVRGGTGFLTIVTELRDEAGSLVVSARSTMIERGEEVA